MSGIFISYRRNDSAGHAGRLHDDLVSSFDRERVFLDIGNLEPGLDFVQALDRAVTSADVLLALIGPHWLTITDADGNRRLDNPNDYVRMEIATALARDDIRVIPVLVGNTSMPRATALPEDLKPLARRHAHEITDERWAYDFGRLTEILRPLMTESSSNSAHSRIDAGRQRVGRNITDFRSRVVKWALSSRSALLIQSRQLARYQLYIPPTILQLGQIAFLGALLAWWAGAVPTLMTVAAVLISVVLIGVSRYLQRRAGTAPMPIPKTPNGATLSRAIGASLLGLGLLVLIAGLSGNDVTASAILDTLKSLSARQRAGMTVVGLALAAYGTQTIGVPHRLWRWGRIGTATAFILPVAGLTVMLVPWSAVGYQPCGEGATREKPALTPTPTLEAANNTLMFRGDPGRTGGSSYTSNVRVQNLLPCSDDEIYADVWSSPTDDIYADVWSSPIIVGNVVYVGSNDGFLYAVDIETGEAPSGWPVNLRSAVWSSPTVYDGVLYAGTRDGKVHALDLNTGRPLAGWHFDAWDPDKQRPVLEPEAERAVFSSMAVAEGKVLFGSQDGNFYAVDSKTGQEVWPPLETGGQVWSSPAVHDGVVYFGSGSAQVFAVDLDSGTENWTFLTDGAVVSSPVLVDNTLYVGSNDGRLYAIDTDTHEDRWYVQTDGPVHSSPAVVENMVYFGSFDGHLYAVDRMTGDDVWRFKVDIQDKEAIWSSPAVVQDIVYFTSNDGTLYALHALTGQELWNRQLNSSGDEGKMRSSPAVVGNTIYVGSKDGSLYRVTFDPGTNPVLVVPATPIATPVQDTVATPVQSGR